SCSSLRWGMPATQGPHQVAQNSTSTTLPRRPARVGASLLLIHSLALTSGGAAPSFGSALSGFLVAATESSRPSGTFLKSRAATRSARVTVWYLSSGSEWE